MKCIVSDYWGISENSSIQVVREIRCFLCLEMKSEPTFGTYQCFKIKTLNKVWKKKIMSLSCRPSSEPRRSEVGFSSQWPAVTYYTNYSFALRHTITSPREFLQICNTCYTALKKSALCPHKLYRVGREKVACLPFCTCPCDILSGVSMYIV